MASDTYYRYQDLIPDGQGFLQVPDDIVIYLIQSQVDQITSALSEATRANGKIRQWEELEFVIVNDSSRVQSGNLEEGDIYFISKVPGANNPTLGSLDMFPKVNDANKLAQTDVDYSEGAEIPDSRNFVKKIRKWVSYNLITQTDYNNIITAIVRSSGSVHNDWVYSLSGEDNGRDKGEVLDIHDRRIDDPNIPLTVKGGVNVGDPDNPTDRKKLSVFGETELQDGTSFGRLLDTYGEQHPMEFGHQIPNEVFPKVYINRGEDRYNAEEWVDYTYGDGLGTIESTKEIVSHTTVNADRGIIIEDGIGDERDRIIEKDVTTNTFNPTGEKTHLTNGFGLSIHHDAAKIQGHTYINDEGWKNEFYLVNSILKQPNDGEYKTPTLVENSNLISGCWVCTEAENENDYKHYCTNKDNKEEVVIDYWPGFLYHKVTKSLFKKEGRVYITADKRYWYEAENDRFVEIQTLDREPNDTELANRYFYVNTVEGKQIQLGYRKVESTVTPIEEEIEEVEDCIPVVEDDIIVGFTVLAPERIIPKILTLYKIDRPFINGYGGKTYTDVFDGEEDLAKNDYLYWTGIKFVKVPTITENELPKLNKTYGSLTVGTRANGIQANDTIGKHSAEIGTNNEATGNNALAQGKDNIASGVSSHAEGELTTASSIDSHAEGYGTTAAGLFSHIEGLGQFDSNIYTNNPNDHQKIYIGESDPQNSIVTGIASHAEGFGQQVEGQYNHAEGYRNTIIDNSNTGLEFVKGSHVEGRENDIIDAPLSHAEGKFNQIKSDKTQQDEKFKVVEAGHAEGAGNIVDRRFQHLEGVLARTTHQVGTYIKDDNQDPEKPVVFAIGDGDSELSRTRFSAIIGEDTGKGVEALENNRDKKPGTDGELYENRNLFAVTEDGDTYVAGHLEVDGTSDLSKRVTIGDDVAAHGLALDVLRHSRFRENVSIDAHGATSNVQGVIDWSVDKSLDVKGQSLFGDTLTIGEAGDRDEETGTFWANLDETDPFNAKSSFNGLYVHGEIHNERIPQELYTSMPVGQDIVLNEFADKFFVNSSIATSTATYRGSYSAIDYAPHVCESITPVDLDDYTVIEYRYNLPTKYTNQTIFDDSDPNVKPTIFYLNNDEGWTPTTNIHPYEIGHTYAKGYYKFVYGAGALINPTKEQIATWLYNHIWKMDPATQVANVYDLDTVTDPDTTKYYYVIGEEKYYRYNNQTSTWVEESPSANNNDYCYFQIWDKKDAEPYVLFAETYDDEGNLITPFIEDEKDPEQEMEIICYRYKFSETRHPSGGAILSSKWVFEYQLNNSGFTQAQWAAINSGISGAWMSNIQTQINNLSNTLTEQVDLLSGRIDTEIRNRRKNNNNIILKFNDFVSKDNKSWSYSYDEETEVGTWSSTPISIDEISGKKNFTNEDGIGFNGAYLKIGKDNDTPNQSIFTLPCDGNGELALKSYVDSEIDNIDYSDFVKIDAIQTITGTKIFEDDTLHIGQSALNGGALGTFILPQEITWQDSGELALKSQVDQITNSLSGYVTLSGAQTITGLKTFKEGENSSNGTIGLGNSTLSRGTSGNGYDFILPQTIPENDSGELALKSDINAFFNESVKQGTFFGTYSVPNKGTKDINISGTVLKTSGNFLNGQYSYKYVFTGNGSTQSINGTNKNHTIIFNKCRIENTTHNFGSGNSDNTTLLNQGSYVDCIDSLTASSPDVRINTDKKLQASWTMTSWFNGREIVIGLNVIWYSNN